MLAAVGVGVQLGCSEAARPALALLLPGLWAAAALTPRFSAARYALACASVGSPGTQKTI